MSQREREKGGRGETVKEEECRGRIVGGGGGGNKGG